jgi:hypothetical protein
MTALRPTIGQDVKKVLAMWVSSTVMKNVLAMRTPSIDAQV